MGRCTFKLLTILMFLVVSQVAFAQNTITYVSGPLPTALVWL